MQGLGEEVRAREQITAIKSNLKYLEENLALEFKKADDNTDDYVKKKDIGLISKLIAKFKDQIPFVKALALKLKMQRDVDPFLNELMNSFEKSIKLEKAHNENINEKLKAIERA